MDNIFFPEHMVHFINIHHQLSHSVLQTLSEIGRFDVSEAKL